MCVTTLPLTTALYQKVSVVNCNDPIWISYQPHVATPNPVIKEVSTQTERETDRESKKGNIYSDRRF